MRSAILLVLLLAPARAPARKAPGRWSVRQRVSGGFAPVDLELLVRSDGELVLTDRRAGKVRSARASKSELRLVAASLDEPAPARKPGPPRCADCRGYTLTVEREGRAPLVRSGQVEDERERPRLLAALSGLWAKAEAGKEREAPVDAPCAGDSDCEAVSVSCTSGCPLRAVSAESPGYRAFLREQESRRAKDPCCRPEGAKSCPMTQCLQPETRPVCVDGTCVLR